MRFRKIVLGGLISGAAVAALVSDLGADDPVTRKDLAVCDDPTIAASASLLGTAGDDVLIGTAGRDVIMGGEGDDIICGRGGNDLILAGPGADMVSGGPGNDKIRGGGGPDVLWGDNGADRLLAMTGADIVYGGQGKDRLNGAGGNDVLDGGDGNDRIDGGRGADELRGSDGRDRLFGGSGVDILIGGLGSDRFFPGEPDGLCEDAVGADREICGPVPPASTAVVGDLSVIVCDTAGERVVIENVSSTVVALDGLRLEDEGPQFDFTFGETGTAGLDLYPGEAISVLSGLSPVAPIDGQHVIAWDRNVWNNGGDHAYLFSGDVLIADEGCT